MDNIITLNDGNGAEVRFEFLDQITYEEEKYVVLLPVEEDADQVVILRVEPMGSDEEAYVGVEDDYTLEAVFSLFRERNQDLFDFDD